jgi:hemerythrin-like domain-containing protein
MDAFQLLKADHQKVAQLFDQLESASGKAKLQVFEQIKTELELHTHIEETIFYPAVEKPKETHDLTLEAYEEHDVVKKLLREMGRARTANEEWEAQAKVLRENVEHHVEEEENELFPKADDVLSEDQIETLGDRMAAEKERKQRGASKSRGASKAAKKAGAAKKAAGGSKKGRSSKKAAKKATKKSGAKKSASKSASRSTAAKTARKSRSTKSSKKSSKKR